MNDTNLNKAIGQLLTYGFQQQPVASVMESHRRVPSDAQEVIRDLQVGGLILMGRNELPPEEMREQLDEFQRLSLEFSGSPLFIAVDQEGGRVNRLNPPGYSRQVSQRQLGLDPDKNAVRTAAAVTGKELKAAGLNWDFAPVLDVDNNPNNPVIGDRSYSPDPKICAELGVQAVLGYQEDAGILACGKHFPGHGDTDIDSHFGLPRIDHGRSRLNDVELIPFKAAINAGIAAIMTSHILFTAIDPELPATMSKTILTGLLREELAFDGLIITDDLEMHGVSVKWGAAEAAVMAVNAGADLVLCCHTLATQYAIRDALVNAVKLGRISLERIEESGKRIASAKAKWLASHVVGMVS